MIQFSATVVSIVGNMPRKTLSPKGGSPSTQEDNATDTGKVSISKPTTITLDLHGDPGFLMTPQDRGKKVGFNTKVSEATTPMDYSIDGAMEIGDDSERLTDSFADSPSLGATSLSDRTGGEKAETGDHSSTLQPSSILQTKRVGVSRTDTRFLWGFYLDKQLPVVDQVFNKFLMFLEAMIDLDESATLVTWRNDDRTTSNPPLSIDYFPDKRSVFKFYLDNFRTSHPPPEKKYYVSFCLNHSSSVSVESLMDDLDELIRQEEWFLIPSAVQTDKPVYEIGWFAYSAREYATPEFRDLLAQVTFTPKESFALQWQMVKEGGKDLYAMTVKAAEGPHLLLSRALSDMYSSSSTSWPWGIKMRFVPYAATLKTKNPAVTNIKNNQVAYTQTYKAFALQYLKEPLDFTFSTVTRSGEKVTLTIRKAIMGITSHRKGKDGEALGIFHGVVEYWDRRFGTRVMVVPYPYDQVGSTLGEMMAQYPYTILSHFYHPDTIKPLFLAHAVQSEEGSTYDPKSDSIRTPAIVELEECMKKDVSLFKFDLSLLEQDHKKRKHEGLVKRLDDSSIGTLRAEPNPIAAGSSKSGARPLP